MSRYFFILLLVFAVLAGCNMLDRHSTPNVTTAPPYWQSESQRQLAESQLDEMRTFHEKESAQIADEMHVFRNHEMTRLENAGKELEKDKRWQEDYEKTVERRKNWTSWFKSKSKDNSNEMSPMKVSEVNKTVQ